MIGIVNYGAGNIRSVANALRKVGADSVYVDTPAQLNNCSRLVLPGVGSFGAMLDFIDGNGFRDPILNWIADERPFLGICLGYQALFERSEESPKSTGLGVFKGEVVRFLQGKVPQIGWNLVVPDEVSIIPRGYYYFVNSYYPIVRSEVLTSTTTYHSNFVSAVEYKNILATQFHPEKSGKIGLELLRRWVRAD